jgi:hypothetical protein
VDDGSNLLSEAQYVFVIGSDTPPEIALFAASIGRSLSRGNDVRFVDEEPEELIVRDPALAKLRISPSEIASHRARLIMCGEADLVQGRAIGNIWRLSIANDTAPAVRLETEGSRHSFPLVMSSSILRRFGRTLAQVPRVLVSVDGSDGRRERMIVRVCQELSSRRWPHSLVVIAPSVKAARRLPSTEVHQSPAAFELAGLIASSTLVLDAVEGDDLPSTVSCLALSVGVPVVAHSTSLLARGPSLEFKAVAEWSPDAFADAVIEAAVEPSSELSWGEEFEAVAEDFGRVIQRA